MALIPVLLAAYEFDKLTWSLQAHIVLSLMTECEYTLYHLIERKNSILITMSSSLGLTPFLREKLTERLRQEEEKLRK